MSYPYELILTLFAGFRFQKPLFQLQNILYYKVYGPYNMVYITRVHEKGQISSKVYIRHKRQKKYVIGKCELCKLKK